MTKKMKMDCISLLTDLVKIIGKNRKSKMRLLECILKKKNKTYEKKIKGGMV